MRLWKEKRIFSARFPEQMNMVPPDLDGDRQTISCMASFFAQKHLKRKLGKNFVCLFVLYCVCGRSFNLTMASPRFVVFYS